MRFAYKYRLYPTKAQAEFLEGQLREACDLYNAAKQERDDAWKTCHKSINYYDQANQLKQMRAEGLIGLANYSCCQDVLRRVDKTYQAFFARVKRGERPGFPRYRSFRRYDSITFPSYGDGCALLDTGKLRVQGVGHVKVKLHRAVKGRSRRLRSRATSITGTCAFPWSGVRIRCLCRAPRSELTLVWTASPHCRMEPKSTIPGSWSAALLASGARSASWRGGNGEATGAGKLACWSPRRTARSATSARPFTTTSAVGW